MHISSLNKLISRRSSLLYHCCIAALPLQSYLLRPTVSLAFGYPYQPSFLHPTHQQQISHTKLAMSSSTNDNNPNNDSSNNKDNLPRVDFTKTETVGTTRWMRLETLSYHVEPDKDDKDNDDGLRKWDRAVRTTKQSEDSIDAVVILAILKNNPSNPLQDEIVCVKQFRPPVNSYTIELPAGLIDANEDISTAALREFTEETGYINGKVTKVLPASYLSPGLTNESASLVRIEVDMSLEQNRKIHTNQVTNDGLEVCEKDRGLEKVLLPRVGLLKALHDLQEKEGVKVFAALYSLALGMEVGESEGLSTVSSTSPSEGKDFPLVELELDNDNNPTEETCQAVTSALRDSGFLIIKTSLLPLGLQQRALSAASSFLDSSAEQVVTHPQDPKIYAMLEGVNSISDDSSIDSASRQDLQDWYTALQKTKTILLQCIAVGLGMKDINYFVKLHNEDNDALRLIKYQPGDATTGNRCKEHSDYGTLTLLLNDGVGGLEAYVDDQWKAVPYVEAGIVVNIGSILSEWTRQELRATLHRVAGPASIGSTTPQDTLLKAVAVPRISLAYFADPNKNVSTVLEDTSGSDEKESEEGSKMSIEEYIEYRSGGQGKIRSGVAFTSTEESRLGI